MTKKIRIAIDGFRIVCERNTSGRAYAIELISALSSQSGVEEIIVLVPWRDDAQISSLAHLPKVSVRCANLARSLDPARSWFRKTYWIQYVIPRLMKLGDMRVDWYIAPYHQCPILLARVKVLVVIHDLCGLRSDCGYSKKSKGYWNHRINFWTANSRADALVPISKYARADFLEHYPSSERKMRQPIYNAVKANVVDPDTCAIEFDKMQLRTSFFIAFSATGPRKGTDITLDAFRAYKEGGGANELILIGGKAGIEYWRNSPNAEGIPGIHWMPHVSDLTRDVLYHYAIALLFPSRCEGFGYPIVEAMRQGCPCIALEASPAKEILPLETEFMQRLEPTELLKLMKAYEKSMHDGTRMEYARRLVEHSLQFADDSLGTGFVVVMS
jgi:glycosyltransferase involved in cell wall biosynthesis